MNTDRKFSSIQILLHWTSAVVIIWAQFSGFYVAFYHPATTVADAISFFNVSLTTVFMPVFVLRLGYYLKGLYNIWTLSHCIFISAAGVGHFMLYLNTITVLVSGVLMMKKDINIFGLMTLPKPLNNEFTINIFYNLHVAACMSLAILIAGHVIAVIVHEMRGKSVLRNMLP